MASSKKVSVNFPMRSLKDETPLNFGKHRGKTPYQLADSDPAYVVWMWNNLRDPPCTKALVLDCEFRIQEERTLEDGDSRSEFEDPLDFKDY